MYKLKNKNNKLGKIINKIDFVNIEGYHMQSKNKYFVIDGERITDIKIVEDSLIYRLITKKVNKKFDTLIKQLTELFVLEDDEEGSMNEVLNRIEKFRQEIKFKYRSYLENKELERMAKQLKVFQKEAKKRLEEINTYQVMNTIGKSR